MRIALKVFNMYTCIILYQSTSSLSKISKSEFKQKDNIYMYILVYTKTTIDRVAIENK